MALLKPKGDVLSKIYAKLEMKDAFFQYLTTLSQNQASTKSRQFAMYGFEILAEISLASEELKSAKA